jgi:hypothetical protein
MFFSAKFNEYLAPYIRMKEQRRLAGIASASKRLTLTTVQQPLNDRLTTVEQSKGKEIKESKVNKGNRVNVFTPPQIEEVKLFFEENGFVNGERAWNYYNDADWKDSTGKPVKNWKQKMRGVWFKDENRKPAPKEKIMTLTEYIDQQKAIGNEDFM